MLDYIPESPYERMQPMRDSFELRLNTFSNWPQNSPVKPLDLVRDYFYYIGIEDKCSCILISKVKVLNIITLVYRLRGHYWLWVLVALLNKWTVWEMFSVFTVDYISYHPTP
jgi:hypothetical protein